MRTLMTFVFSAMFSLSVSAYSGSSAGGPHVDCKLPNGDMKFIPVEACKQRGGEIKH
ncbi:hypothetical protein [Vibrio maerlii]|uniref:hypothetical protein n=1 Tax=Vibrio maerlii TaxID=2231648 RepID=UPI0013DEBFD6|nr:hypothetical protein [Vibrio maerlii]